MLCTLMPQIIPLLTLMLVCMWYEGSPSPLPPPQHLDASLKDKLLGFHVFG
jgi:hypothetical protein